MADQVKAPRRAYSSPLRTEQAQQTRRRVLETARRLFIDHGYAGTTIAAVAEAAEVSPELIYTALGGKRGLLEGVMEITGPRESAADDEAWWAMVAELADPADRLDKMVEYSCRILARTWPIHAIIRGAADKDAFARGLGHRLLEDRLDVQTERIRRHLDGALKAGLRADEAGQRYCALTSPELFYLLTVELGWSRDDHRSWITNLLRSELLADR